MRWLRGSSYVKMRAALRQDADSRQGTQGLVIHSYVKMRAALDRTQAAGRARRGSSYMKMRAALRQDAGSRQGTQGLVIREDEGSPEAGRRQQAGHAGARHTLIREDEGSPEAGRRQQAGHAGAVEVGQVARPEQSRCGERPCDDQSRG